MKSGTVRRDLIVTLLTKNQFDRSDVALLMATAYRWGYEQRVEEEEQQLIPVAFSATEVIRDLERIAYRKECDRAARQPWPTDREGRNE